MDNLKALAPVARPINYMLKEYGARFHAKADFVTLPTQSAIDMYDAYSKVRVPMEAVSNGIDLTKYTVGVADPELLERFKLPTDRPIITYIGRVDAEKHLFVLIRAFVRVLAEKEAHLLVVGDGTDVANLKVMAQEVGILDHVTFTGRVSDADLVALHKVGTVYCMPSPAELQSIATLEAMASGQPVVAVDAGALGELCQNERNGFLCEKDNDEQIAVGLLKLITDKKLRAKMSAESLAIAKTHNLEDTLCHFEAIYAKLING
jgi:glycosyltransferase involved in cell wall biosynthesis